MSNPMTPTRLQQRVDEWREARERKLAGRLQLHAEKSRIVSAKVLGLCEPKRVQLPTPPSAKTNEPRSRQSSVNQSILKKSFSYGDVNNYQQQRNQSHSHDYRNGGGLSRHEPRSPYVGYSQGSAHHPKSPGYYHHQHPRTPQHYASQDYRGTAQSWTEPRKSFAPPGAYRNYGASGSGNGGHRNQYHQNPSTPNYSNKGIRKDNNQPQRNKPAPQPGTSKETTARKSIAPKEKTVTFEDEVRKEVNSGHHSDSSVGVAGAKHPSEAAVINEGNSAGTDSPLNTTFTLDDGESTADAPESNSVGVVETTQASSDSAQEIIAEPGSMEVAVATEPENIEAGKVTEPENMGTAKAAEPEYIKATNVTEQENLEAEMISEPTNTEVAVENGQYETNVELKLESVSAMDKVAADLVDQETIQLDEELRKEVLAISPALLEDADNDMSSFSLCLESNSSPWNEVVIESNDVNVEQAMDVHEPELLELSHNESVFYFAEEAPAIESTPETEPAFDPLEEEKPGSSSPERKEVDAENIEQPNKDKAQSENIDVLTEDLDVLYITPRKGRKSRALLDTTNIVESSSIQYVVREVKQKEAHDVIITPVRRSTRKKVETPGTVRSMQELSPEVLQKAKILPNRFLN